MTKRAAYLIAGSVPGYVIGIFVLHRIDVGVLKVATGIVVILLAIVQILQRRPAFAPGPGSFTTAGAVGGVLGVTTSLNGVVPALVMGQARVSNRQFLADLAVYLVGSSLVGLAAVTITGISAPNIWLLLLVSLPLSILANQLGITLGSKLPQRTFRAIMIAIIICSGVAAILS
ncbi:MAG: hypothetical protein ABS81_05395 [Pseudonocardia sp. SCN 72-86]|nr:MAG: hypothetical protein ABS81_05395 [Pseudonocardia sp. SCN 72-86]